ncbi:hypothetical protein B0H10DRAFT_2187765 [Mycena sp. CBHHK59/15]|nr:hypothetical protein B0H10DRAFT_2187765 [Mycena sp. CBHHK59/15]
MVRMRNEPVQHTRGFTFYSFGTTPALPWFRMALTGLQKRATPAKIKEAFMARILNHAEAVGLIERSHDFIPGDYNTEFILKVALHFTVINTCAVHPTQNSAPQTVFRIYMPPLTKDLDKNRALMEHIASRDFSFNINVPGRGLAQPWLGNPNTPNARPMVCTGCCGIDHYKQDCPILNSAGYRSTHDIVDVDMNAQSEVATTLSLVTTDPSNAAPTSSDTGGWQTVRGSYRGNPYRGVGRNYRGGYNRGGRYGGYGHGGRSF